MALNSVTMLYTYGIIFVALLLTTYWLFLYFDIRENGDINDLEKEKGSRFKPRIAVLIPTLNEGEILRKTVENVAACDYPVGKMSIYIVLNKGSKKPTRDIARSMHGKNVRIIDAPMNGKSKVMNYALKKYVKEQFILILDSDTLVDKELIRRLVVYFKDEKVGAVVSSVEVLNPRTFSEQMQRYEYLLSIIARKALSYLGGLLIVHGAGSMFRRTAMKDVGYFDEDNYSEDMEIGMHLLTKGYKVESSLNARSYTKAPDTLRALFVQRKRWFSGFFHNISKYRKVIFQKKYSSLGLLVVPFMLVSVFFSVFVVALLVYSFLSWAVPLYYLTVNTNFWNAVSVQLSSSTPTVYSINYLSVLSILSFIVAMFSVFFSLRVIDAKVSAIKDSFGILIYTIFYSFFLSFIWIYGLLIFAIKRRGEGWKTNT